MIGCNINNISINMCNFLQLEYLCLYENEISEIPKEIENLINLKYLSLDKNKITIISEKI
jgi:Leucine-rich repeat (LRR) protein